MRRAVASLAYAVLIPVVILFYILAFVYMIDLVLGGRILVLIFVGPLFLAVLSWSAMLAFAPVAAATQEEASDTHVFLGALMLPVGLLGGFMLWQVQNWVVYRFLDVEPELYNSLFKVFGLQV